jgi:hypothetical protein
LKVWVVSMLAVFAFGAVAATGAQAKTVKGPFYRIEKNRLQNLESREITNVQNGNQVLKAGAITVTCTKLKSTGFLEGSHNENAGKSFEKLEYTGCTVTGNGEPCSVTEPITAEVEDIQGYAELNAAKTEGKGQLLTIFKPWSETEPLVFTTIHFTGTGCAVTSTKVETTAGGGVCGEDINGAGLKVTTTANQTETAENEVWFPTASTHIFEEIGGNFAESPCALKAFGVAATLEGKVKVKLVSGKVWGVVTK